MRYSKRMLARKAALIAYNIDPARGRYAYITGMHLLLSRTYIQGKPPPPKKQNLWYNEHDNKYTQRWKPTLVPIWVSKEELKTLPNISCAWFS